MTIPSSTTQQFPLVDRVVRDPQLLARAQWLPSIDLSQRALSDLYLLATGGFSPLPGFLNFDDSRSVVNNLSLGNGTLWPIPILLQVDSSRAAGLHIGTKAALRFNGGIVGTIDIEEIFGIPAAEWSRGIFQTDDPAHPGVAAFRTAGELGVAGPVEWLVEPHTPELGFNGLTPDETRAAVALRGWKSIVGFQTRNPIHRAHEYILRTALETLDGLLLHPLVGETRDEDIPADIRLRCYEALLENYLPQERVLFTTYHGWMRYGGPREAVLHALIRRNFGCTHFLVGRDHAGVGNYYGPYDAQQLLRSIGTDRLGIEPVYFDSIFYCNRCRSMATARTCAHPPASHLSLSGTEVRRRLRDGDPLPEEFTRPEVAAQLREAYAEVSHA